MVEVAEIVDRDTFLTWLEQKDLPREAVIALAHRAAMRVLPLIWREFALEGSKKDGVGRALAVLRANLVCGAAASGETPKTKIAAVTYAGYLSVSFVADASSAVASAADVYAAVAASVANASVTVASIADAYASASAAASLSNWAVLRRDCEYIHDVAELLSQPIWRDAKNPLEDEWVAIKSALRAPTRKRGDVANDAAHTQNAKAPDPWFFWLDWYQRALDGTEIRWPLLRDIALLDIDDSEGLWKDPEKLALEIARLEAEYADSQTEKTDLAKAYPVDFTFDAMARVMRMVGIDDDMAHLRDPAVVQAFLDDCEELRDELRDFIDFAEAGADGSNLSGMLHLAAEKVLRELTRTQDAQHLRARHIVRLAQRLEAFAKEKGARDELGNTLAGMLDTSISLLRTVTRKHFGPSYTALAPLAQLTLDQIDRDAVLDLFDRLIERIEALPSGDLVALDEDGLSVFRDLIREVHEFRAAVAEATTDDFRTMMENRFAESIGGAGLAFGRFLETSATAAGQVDTGVDRAIKNYKRVKGINDIVAFMGDLLGGGG